MKKLYRVCGVDCHSGDDKCNFYCKGGSPSPEQMTQPEVEKTLRDRAYAKLFEAGVSWYEYFAECEVGPDRTFAAEVYERLRNATRK